MDTARGEAHTIGDAFCYQGRIRLGGEPDDFTDCVAYAAIQGGGVYTPLVCGLELSGGETLLTISALAEQQAAWREGVAKMDVLLATPDGDKLHSNPIYITLRRAVTEAAP
jgi:hypothetical protein